MHMPFGLFSNDEHIFLQSIDEAGQIKMEGWILIYN